MRWNRNLELVGGVGANHSSYWPAGEQPRSLGAGLAGGVWLDDDTILTVGQIQTDGGPQDRLLACRRADNWAPHEFEPTAGRPAPNVWAAGGGNWAATIQTGTYQTYGLHGGRPLPPIVSTRCGVIDASRAGDLLFRDFSGSAIAVWADGTVESLGPCQWATMRDGGAVVWDGQDLWLREPGRPGRKCAVLDRSGINNAVRLGDWISYATDRLGRVLHRYDDATQGYRLTMGFSPDLIQVGGRCFHAVSRGAAELPSDLHTDPPIVLSQGMVPLAAPTVPVTVPRLPPMPVAWLEIYGDPQSRFMLADNETSAADARARGYFLEFQSDASADAISAAIASALPACRRHGLPLIVDVESYAADVARVRAIASEMCTAAGVRFVPSIDLYPPSYETGLADVTACLAQYGDCHVWLALYRQIHGDLTSYSWTEPQVLDTIGRVWPRLGGVRWASVFTFDRADGRDGIVSLDSFQRVAAQLVQQARGADAWPLPPVAAPEPPPRPEPAPAPEPGTARPDPRPQQATEPWIDPRPGCPGVGWVLQGNQWVNAGTAASAKAIYDAQLAAVAAFAANLPGGQP